MAGKFSVKVEQSNGITIVRPEGRLDTSSSVEFEKRLTQLARDQKLLLLDLEALEFLSSYGIRVILVTAKALKRRDGRFAMHSPKPHVLDVFKMAGINRVLRIHDGRAQAMAAMSQ